MKQKIMKILCWGVLSALILAAGAGILLGLRRMNQGVHSNVNRTRTEVLNAVSSLEAKVNALEAQVNLASPDMNQNAALDYSWVEGNRLIAHALGGLTLDGYVYEYSNSLEAFRENYEKGIRVFEADLILTSDGALAAAHDWTEFGSKEPLTLGEFQAADFYDGQATQLTGGDIIDLLVEYPDIYLVTDTKYTDLNHYRLQFSQLLYLAREKNAEEVLDRVIVQVYNQGMYDIIYDIHPWKSVIYTLYQSPDTMESVLSFCRDRGIKVVTMGWAGATEADVAMLRDAGITTYTYTVNDPEEARRELDMGIGGVYTDSLSPEDLGE